MQFNQDQAYWNTITETVSNFNTKHEKKYVGQISFNYQPTPIAEPMSLFLLDTSYANNETMKHAFSNIRTNVKDADLEYVQLEIGGNIIDRVHGNILKVLRDLYGIKDKTVIPFGIFSDNNYFPVLAQQEIRIMLNLKTGIKFNNLFSINADLYELNPYPANECASHATHNYLYRCIQAPGSVILNGTCKHQLYFVDNVQYLIIKSDNQINSLNINLANRDGRLFKRINVQNLTRNGEYYVIPFVQNNNNLKDGLNCSVLDLTLEFVFAENKITEVNVFGVSSKEAKCDHLRLH
jgi:hypothetical protein